MSDNETSKRAQISKIAITKHTAEQLALQFGWTDGKTVDLIVNLDGGNVALQLGEQQFTIEPNKRLPKGQLDVCDAVDALLKAHGHVSCNDVFRALKNEASNSCKGPNKTPGALFACVLSMAEEPAKFTRGFIPFLMFLHKALLAPTPKPAKPTEKAARTSSETFNREEMIVFLQTVSNLLTMDSTPSDFDSRLLAMLATKQTMEVVSLCKSVRGDDATLKEAKVLDKLERFNPRE